MVTGIPSSTLTQRAHADTGVTRRSAALTRSPLFGYGLAVAVSLAIWTVALAGLMRLMA